MHRPCTIHVVLTVLSIVTTLPLAAPRTGRHRRRRLGDRDPAGTGGTTAGSRSRPRRCSRPGRHGHPRRPGRPRPRGLLLRAHVRGDAGPGVALLGADAGRGHGPGQRSVVVCGHFYPCYIVVECYQELKMSCVSSLQSREI